MANYVIKKGSLYLHVNPNDMTFKEQKDGAKIFEKNDALIVLKILAKNHTHIFKSKIKDKFIVGAPKNNFIDNWRKNRLRKKNS